MMEISDQIRSIISVISRFPGVVSRGITFPTNQVLKGLTFTTASGIENLLDFILNLIGNNNRWGRGLNKGFDNVLCFGFE